MRARNIESAPGIDAYGPVNTYYPVEDPNWGTAGTAVATWVHPSWPSISSAQWISTSYYLDSDGTESSWRWFHEEFYVPDDAIVLPRNVVWTTSDNARAGKNWATYIEYAVQPDLLGDWIFVYHYGANYVHEMTITDQDSSTFSGTGKYPAGGPYTITWTVSGTYSGNTISFHIDYDSSSYYVDATGTINPVGTMNGPATAPSQTATWDAYRP